MRDWSKPQQQSVVALIMLGIKVGKQLITIFWPLLLATIFKKRDNAALFWSIGLGVALLFIIIKSIADYIAFRFYVFNNELIIRSGIIKKKVITIPLEKIQTVHLEQHFWHTLTGTTKVLIDTPGSEKTEVAIQALSTTDANAFREMLLAEKSTAVQQVNAISDRSTILQLKSKDLLWLSLSANHFETLGLMLFFVLSRLDDVKKIFEVDAFDWLETQTETTAFTWRLIMIVLGLMLTLAFIISVVRTVLRYFNMQVTQNSKGLIVKWGLIQVKQHIIPLHKIQLVEWKANWLRRKLGLYLVQLKATGEDANERKKQKIIIPTVEKHQTTALATAYQPQIDNHAWNNSIQKVYVKRKLLLIGLPITLLLMATTVYWWHWYALLFLLWFVYYAISVYTFQQQFKFGVNHESIYICKGVWGRKHMILNWEKIQLVVQKQTLFQQQKGYANIELHTAGGSITIPYLTISEANTLHNYALYQLESANKNWV